MAILSVKNFINVVKGCFSTSLMMKIFLMKWAELWFNVLDAETVK